MDSRSAGPQRTCRLQGAGIPEPLKRPCGSLIRHRQMGMVVFATAVRTAPANQNRRPQGYALRLPHACQGVFRQTACRLSMEGYRESTGCHSYSGLIRRFFISE
jgi:hypothetical protein